MIGESLTGIYTDKLVLNHRSSAKVLQQTGLGNMERYGVKNAHFSFFLPRFHSTPNLKMFPIE